MSIFIAGWLPKVTLTSLLSTYTLTSNDIVYIDVGVHNYKPVFTTADQDAGNKYLSIIGAGIYGKQTVFDGEFNSTRGYCMEINGANYIKISGITFKNGYYRGLYLYNGVSKCYIYNNIFISNLRGIYLQRANNNWIVSNEVKKCYTYQIWDIDGGDNNKIIKNQGI